MRPLSECYISEEGMENKIFTQAIDDGEKIEFVFNSV
jgi:hypothetical protein